MSLEQMDAEFSDLWTELAKESEQPSENDFKDSLFPVEFTKKSWKEKILQDGASGLTLLTFVVGSFSLLCGIDWNGPGGSYLAPLGYAIFGVVAGASVLPFLRNRARLNPLRLVCLALGLQIAVPFWLSVCQSLLSPSQVSRGWSVHFLNRLHSSFWYSTKFEIFGVTTTLLVAAFIAILVWRHKAPWYDEAPPVGKHLWLSATFFLTPFLSYFALLMVGQPSSDFLAWQEDFKNTDRAQRFKFAYTFTFSRGPWESYQSSLIWRVPKPKSPQVHLTRVEQLLHLYPAASYLEAFSQEALLAGLLEESRYLPHLKQPEKLAAQLFLLENLWAYPPRKSRALEYFDKKLREKRSPEELAVLEKSLTALLQQVPTPSEIVECEMMLWSHHFDFPLSKHSLMYRFCESPWDPWELNSNRRVNALHRNWQVLSQQLESKELNAMLATPEAVPTDSDIGARFHSFLKHRESLGGKHHESFLQQPRLTRQRLEQLIVVSRLRCHKSVHRQYPKTISELQVPEGNEGRWEIQYRFEGRPGPQPATLIDREGTPKEWMLP